MLISLFVVFIACVIFIILDFLNFRKQNKHFDKVVIPGSVWYVKKSLRKNPDLKDNVDWSITISRTYKDDFGTRTIEYTKADSDMIYIKSGIGFFDIYTNNEDGRKS